MKNCPKCGAELYVNVEITGGCSGDHGEGSYCYCPYQDISAYTYCPGKLIERPDKRVKGGINRSVKPCGFRKDLEGLRDKYGFESWIAERL